MNPKKRISNLAATITIIGTLVGGVQASEILEAVEVTSQNELLNSGDWLIGGLLSYDSFDQEDDPVDFYSIDIEADYLLTNNISIGLSAKFSLAEDDEYKDVTSSIGVNARYYYKTQSSLTPYIGVHYSYNHSDSKSNIPGDGGSDTYGGFGGHIGTLAKIRPNVYLDARLSYTDYNISDFNDKEFVQHNVNLSIGVKWKF